MRDKTRFVILILLNITHSILFLKLLLLYNKGYNNIMCLVGTREIDRIKTDDLHENVSARETRCTYG